MSLLHECPTCGETFETRRGLGVHHTLVHDEQLPNRVCGHCQSDFHSPHERKYCSPECRKAAVSFEGSDNPNFDGSQASSECHICGREFESYPSQKPGSFCPECVASEEWQTPSRLVGADNPQWSGGKERRRCAVCGDTVERYPSEFSSETVFCGRECHASWLSEAFTGDGHPNYYGGGNGSDGKGRNLIRKKALERDGYACVVCSKTKSELGRNPDVHHIVPVREFIESDTHDREDAHYLGNVVSLCIDCHRKADFGKIPREKLRSLIR